jgi:hypothetical protein
MIVAISGTLALAVALSIWRLRRGRLSKPFSSSASGADEPAIAQAPIESPTISEIPDFDVEAAPPTLANYLQNAQTTAPLSTERKRVVNLYARACRLAEQSTGVRMEPYTTLNEFLQMAYPKLNGARVSFSMLTSLAEKSLYSYLDSEAAEVTMAESYLRTFEEAMKHGSA